MVLFPSSLSLFKLELRHSLLNVLSVPLSCGIWVSTSLWLVCVVSGSIMKRKASDDLSLAHLQIGVHGKAVPKSVMPSDYRLPLMFESVAMES